MVQSDPQLPDDEHFIQWSASDFVECLPAGSPTCRPGSVIAPHTRRTDADSALISRKVEYALERAVVVSRDGGIVTPQPLIADPNGVIRLDAVAAGTTWIVVRVDDAIDSVQVTVAP